VSCKREQSLFDHDEYALVRQSHHPAIYALGEDELMALRGQLRQLRDKEKTLARQKRREVRGKAEPRGGSFPGTAQRPQERKTALTAAVRRVGKELHRQAAMAARTAQVEAARRALALRRAHAFVHHPVTDPGAMPDVAAVPSRRRRTSVPGAHVGRVSQHNKMRQAVRDARN
jgi:hypothetical protein